MAEKTTLDKEIEEAHKLRAKEAEAKKQHGDALAAIDKEKQFLVRDKIAQVMTLLKELGFSEIQDDRGNTILDVRETDIGALTGKAY